MPRLAAAVPGVTCLRPPGPTRLARHLAAARLGLAPRLSPWRPAGGGGGEEAASASSSGKWGQGSRFPPPPSPPPPPTPVPPAASCSRNTPSRFHLGTLAPAVPSTWDLPTPAFFGDGIFVILVYSQMPPPDHRPKQHPPELTNHSLFCTAAIQVLFRGLLNISPPVPELRMGNKWRTGSERQDRVLGDVQWPLWVSNLLSLTPREQGVTEVARPGSRGRAQADRKGPAGHVGTSPHPLTAHPPPCSGRDKVGDREGPGPPKSSRPGGRASPFSLFNLALLS